MEYNSFSPNNDGKNDFWFISKALNRFPDNQVKIFNSWGEEVFKMSGYNNNDKIFQAEGLNDGTYYYTIFIPKINKKVAGYLMVIR